MLAGLDDPAALRLIGADLEAVRAQPPHRGRDVRQLVVPAGQLCAVHEILNERKGTGGRFSWRWGVVHGRKSSWCYVTAILS